MSLRLPPLPSCYACQGKGQVRMIDGTNGIPCHQCRGIGIMQDARIAEYGKDCARAALQAAIDTCMTQPLGPKAMTPHLSAASVIRKMKESL